MYICIEGNIGSGKSTLAKALAKKLKATFLPERFEENTLLPIFYKEPKKYAFPTEYSFLIDRQKQLSTYFNQTKTAKYTVSDFHFDKCLCFAKANLGNNDYLFFKKHFKALQQSIVQPDLVVYLHTEIKLIQQNIKKRGRELEKEIDVNYLLNLKKSLDNYYLKQKKSSKLLILEMNEYNEKSLELCCDKIIDKLNFIY